MARCTTGWVPSTGLDSKGFVSGVALDSGTTCMGSPRPILRGCGGSTGAGSTIAR
jgi:hypothetical protein